MGRCCSNNTATDGRPVRRAPHSGPLRSRLARTRSALAWALPIATLALVPKCPACVAGYVLLFTGIGVSLPVAGGMRWALMVLSVTAITWLLVRSVTAVLRRRMPAA
jgi:hypothetical protein